MKSFYILLVLIFFSSCSRKSDIDLYNEGKIAEGNKSFSEAAELFEEAVSRFSTSAYAESSLLRLAFMYNNDLKDARKAINAYQRFYETFSTSSQAPTMLFLAGFIYNNELHVLDSAKMIYEIFLQKFPDHELAPSAKFELETLGKEPTQAFTPPIVISEKSDTKQTSKPGRK